LPPRRQAVASADFRARLREQDARCRVVHYVSGTPLAAFCARSPFLGGSVMTAASNRREFLHATVAAGTAAGLAASASGADTQDAAGLPTRPLGKTGVRV